MRSLFRKLTIVRTVVANLIVFSVTLLILAIISLTSAVEKLNIERMDRRIIAVLDAYIKVAHHHAVERGLTAGYLGAPDNTKKANLDAQRSKADASLSELNTLLNQDWPEEIPLKRHHRLLTEHVTGKSQIRQQVDQLAAPGAFGYYSSLNKLALDTANMLRIYMRDGTLQQGVASGLQIAWFKERAGQARGKINGVLARGNLSADAKNDITGYIAEMQALTDYLALMLSGEELSEFNQIMDDPNSRAIAQVHSGILASEGSLDMNRFPPPGDWFPMATEQIVAVNKLLNRQLDALNQKAIAAERAAWIKLLMEMILVLGAAALLAVLNFHLVRTTRRNLNRLTGMLRQVAERGDLTMNLNLKSDDELGDISRAINQTIHAFRDLIVGLATSIEASSRLSIQLNTVSNKVVSDAQNTQDRANNISASVEEMATTSGDIANSATRALEASDKLNGIAQRSQEVNQQTEQAMTQLSDKMSEVEGKAGSMEEQVSSITGILETINTLAEQTNLLALNAAIEAARAGEHGRGFAVVADEVRNLAKGSKESSDQIAVLLEGLQSASNEVVDAVRTNTSNTQGTLERAAEARTISQELKDQAKLVEDLSTQVATAAEQQSVTARHIAEDTNQVLEAAQDELEAAKEMYEIFHDLEQNGETLQRTMDNFIIEEGADASERRG